MVGQATSMWVHHAGVRVSIGIATTSLVGCLMACRSETPDGSTGPQHARTMAQSQPAAKTSPAPVKQPNVGSDPVPELPTRFSPAPRIVAIGDVHGDLDATRAALRLGGAIDSTDRWVGGELVVVQTGDQLDRGPDERAILALLERLTLEAEIAGGALHVLNGNHELMNALGDFRYVTPEGFESFADIPDVRGSNPALAGLPPVQRPRGAAFFPGGPYAQALARRNTVVIVGDTVFVHGGVLPKHARRIDALNASVRTWLAGGLSDPQPLLAEMMAPDGPVWTRIYSEPTPTTKACAALDEALRLMSAARMVVGHTVQHEGITSACNDKVWRIDVGMAEHYGGSVQVLEIAGNEVRALEPPSADG